MMEDVKRTITGKKLTCGISSSLDEIIARKGITKNVSSSENRFASQGTTTVVLERLAKNPILVNDDLVKQETVQNLQKIISLEATELYQIVYEFMKNRNDDNFDFYIRCFEKKAINKNVFFSTDVEAGYYQGILYLKKFMVSWKQSQKTLEEYFAEQVGKKEKQKNL